jgi:hypothetical protein
VQHQIDKEKDATVPRDCISELKHVRLMGTRRRWSTGNKLVEQNDCINIANTGFLFEKGSRTQLKEDFHHFEM